MKWVKKYEKKRNKGKRKENGKRKEEEADECLELKI